MGRQCCTVHMGPVSPQGLSRLRRNERSGVLRKDSIGCCRLWNDERPHKRESGQLEKQGHRFFLYQSLEFSPLRYSVLISVVVNIHNLRGKGSLKSCPDQMGLWACLWGTVLLLLLLLLYVFCY